MAVQFVNSPKMIASATTATAVTVGETLTTPGALTVNAVTHAVSAIVVSVDARLTAIRKPTLAPTVTDAKSAVCAATARDAVNV
jgi:hypothetical protein